VLPSQFLRHCNCYCNGKLVKKESTIRELPPDAILRVQCFPLVGGAAPCMLVLPGGSFEQKILAPNACIAALLASNQIEEIESTSVVKHFAWLQGIGTETKWKSLLSSLPDSSQKQALLKKYHKNTGVNKQEVAASFQLLPRTKTWLQHTRDLPEYSESVRKENAALSKILNVAQKVKSVKKIQALLLEDCLNKVQDILQDRTALQPEELHALTLWANRNIPQDAALSRSEPSAESPTPIVANLPEARLQTGPQAGYADGSIGQDAALSTIANNAIEISQSPGLPKDQQAESGNQDIEQDRALCNSASDLIESAKPDFPKVDESTKSHSALKLWLAQILEKKTMPETIRKLISTLSKALSVSQKANGKKKTGLTLVQDCLHALEFVGLDAVPENVISVAQSSVKKTKCQSESANDSHGGMQEEISQVSKVKEFLKDSISRSTRT